MTIIQHFDPQKKMFFVVWQGTVEADQWFHHAAKLTSHPSWSTTRRILADLQYARDTSTIGKEEIARAVQIFSSESKALANKQIAVIARDQFGKARHFGDLIARFGVALVVFNNLDTACLFLGLDVSYASQRIHEMCTEPQEE